MNYQGMLIYRERNRRNWSQEGLCRGICTVSYLSKIENGKAEPSEEILRMLLERLELHTSAELEAEAGKAAEEAWELLFSERSEAFRKAMSSRPSERWRATAAGLDFLLLERIAAYGEPVDSVPESCMTPRQLAVQRLLQRRFSEAVALLPNGWCHLQQGLAAYETGSYSAALESLQTGYNLAAAEGHAHLMLSCRLFMGNIYCNRREMDSMRRHYTVARRLAAALGDEKSLSGMNYNEAAAQMDCGQYDEAYAYFSGLEHPDMLSLHKLAICCEKTGRPGEAMEALDRADQTASSRPEDALYRLMCAVVRYRLEHPGYLKDEAYGRLLLDCFDTCRREMPVSFAAFHLPWVMEWYKSARMYRKALELAMDFPELPR